MNTNFKTWFWAVGLSGVLVAPVNYLFSLIPWSKFIEPESYEWFVTPVLHISIFHMLLFVIILAGLLCLFYFAKRTIVKQRMKAQGLCREQLVAELKSFNHLTFEDNNTVEVRWTVVEPGLYHHHYHSINVEFYCLNHPTPMLMPHGFCTLNGCSNNKFHVYTNEVQNQIDSMIIERARELGLEQ